MVYGSTPRTSQSKRPSRIITTPKEDNFGVLDIKLQPMTAKAVVERKDKLSLIIDKFEELKKIGKHVDKKVQAKRRLAKFKTTKETNKILERCSLNKDNVIREVQGAYLLARRTADSL